MISDSYCYLEIRQEKSTYFRICLASALASKQINSTEKHRIAVHCNVVLLISRERKREYADGGSVDSFAQLSSCLQQLFEMSRLR